MMGMMLSPVDIVTIRDDSTQDIEYSEADMKRTEIDRYERNLLYKKICLETKWYECTARRMNFDKIYGNIGCHYIQVHCAVPVSELESGHTIDPVKDLAPVCPNCHACCT